MGMDYYIIPEIEVNCEHEFPEGLSFFFEQVGGYEEYAEVSQVSKILQIDLSVFQEISYDDGEEYSDFFDEEEEKIADDSATIWHSTVTAMLLIDDLLAKIAAFPDYHKQVLHNPTRRPALESLLQAATARDEEKLKQMLEEVESIRHSAYPPDYGYLSEERIVEDLKTLRKTLTCYEGSGASRFKLIYM
jgi:hypothetical protein